MADIPEDIPEYLMAQTRRLCENLVRVDSLIDLHSFASSLLDGHRELPREYRASDREPPSVDDILRSATVLLHAALEDFLRTVALAHLPRQQSDCLKHIPITGTGQRPGKVTLGDLTMHSGKSIDSVIEESLDEWLHQQSFSNCADIAAMLEHLGIDVAYCNVSFSHLEDMIARRHRIVHNADRTRDQSEGNKSLSPISVSTVQQWRDAVEQFMRRALYQLHLVVEGQARANS